jgi:hypothetical protein
VVTRTVTVGDLRTTTVTTGFTGSLTGKTALLPNTIYWVRVGYKDDTHMVGSADWSQFTTGIGEGPDQPVISTPSDGAMDVVRPVDLEASTYDDSPEDDVFDKAVWQFSSTNDFVGDLDLEETVDPGTTTLETTGLDPSTTYYVRVKYVDEAAAESAWSGTRTFTTAVGVAPTKPAIQTPNSGASDVSRNPALTANDYVDTDGDDHIESLWEVRTDCTAVPPDEVVVSRTVTLGDLRTTTVSTGFTGTLTGKTALLPNTVYWVRVGYKDDTNMVGTADWSEFTTGLGESPDRPTIVLPSNGASPVTRPVDLEATDYDDSPEGDAFDKAVWQFAVSTDFAADLELEEEVDPGDKYLTTAKLRAATTYYVRVKYVDGYGAESSWSNHIWFTTQGNTPPAKPSIVSPAGPYPALNQPRNITLGGSAYSDDSGATDPVMTDWQVCADGFDGTDAQDAYLCAYAYAETVNFTTVEASAPNLTFVGDLRLHENLTSEGSHTYYVRLRYCDSDGAWSDWSDFVDFTTDPTTDKPQKPTIESPAANATGVRLSPVISADQYVDPSDDKHESTDWMIYDDVSLTPGLEVARSLNNTNSLTSITVDGDQMEFLGALSGKTSLARLTDYWVVVVYRDDLGAISTPSDAVHFTTGDYAEGDDWSFFGKGCAAREGAGGATALLAALGCLACLACRVRRRTSAR